MMSEMDVKEKLLRRQAELRRDSRKLAEEAGLSEEEIETALSMTNELGWWRVALPKAIAVLFRHTPPKTIWARFAHRMLTMAALAETGNRRAREMVESFLQVMGVDAEADLQMSHDLAKDAGGYQVSCLESPSPDAGELEAYKAHQAVAEMMNSIPEAERAKMSLVEVQKRVDAILAKYPLVQAIVAEGDPKDADALVKNLLHRGPVAEDAG